MKETVKDKLIIALDVETITQAREVVAALRGVAGMFKVGSQLFTATGPQIVREIVSGGGRVFLDLKFHDIPNVVASAAVEATRLGVSLFTIHALGGREMLRRTAEAVTQVSERERLARPKVFAVTVLTSADQETLAEVGITSDILTQVRNSARLAEECGVDGVVASPHEVSLIRAEVSRKNFLIVTPGVRPHGTAHDDQKRVMTPAEAIRAGADYIVVGRAILNAADPAQAASEIIAEMGKQ